MSRLKTLALSSLDDVVESTSFFAMRSSLQKFMKIENIWWPRNAKSCSKPAQHQIKFSTALSMIPIRMCQAIVERLSGSVEVKINKLDERSSLATT